MAWSKVTSLGATPNAGGFSAACPIATTALDVYTDFGPAVPFTKLYPGTTLRVTISAAAEYTSGGGATVQFGFRIGVDTHDVVRFPLKSRSVAFMVSGTARVAGLPTGPLSIQPAWRRPAGSSIVSMDPSMDYSVQIEETL